ncbi:MAG: FGGY family carbohydrate kinase, partial [Anaerolineaceae bacterium]
MPQNLLAIDNGTQSVRALVFDPRGNLIARQRSVIQPYYSDRPGWAEQNPEVFWNALCAACQGLWQIDGLDRSSIAAVALTTQRA